MGLCHCRVYTTDHTDPKELWDKIREGYRRTLHVWHLRQELYNLQLQVCKCVLNYMMKIDMLVEKYNFAKGDTENGRMPDDEHTFFYINRLPESWREAIFGFRLNKSLVDSPKDLEMAIARMRKI